MSSDSLFSNLTTKPKMIIFDLDCTLWPFDCDYYLGHRFRRNGSTVVDSNNDVVEVCADSESILQSIKRENGVLLACASRTPTPEIARQLVQLRGWHLLFDFMEIYPSSKVKHFNALSKKTGVHFNEMIFFDDLDWNIQDAKQLGLHAHHVRNGITNGLVRRALEEYQKWRTNQS
ncbi:magnesium-dependent phosphatase 1 [Clonorchis sinensis]|uniref:Magnesium-dependent phosphatase 1 n=1 Tax=Clonorchis sinensis TaxID=79923 RepID=H2KU64_CLOSI|nr:magnesium-dependent phosphatase 1 [Clonorchis sinensis]